MASRNRRLGRPAQAGDCVHEPASGGIPAERPDSAFDYVACARIRPAGRCVRHEDRSVDELCRGGHGPHARRDLHRNGLQHLSTAVADSARTAAKQLAKTRLDMHPPYRECRALSSVYSVNRWSGRPLPAASRCAKDGTEAIATLRGLTIRGRRHPHGRGYHHRDRSGKAQLSGARGPGGRVGGVPQEAEPGEAAGLSGNAAAVHGGDGGVRQRPLLGPGDCGARPRGEAGSPDLREAVRARRRRG